MKLNTYNIDLYHDVQELKQKMTTYDVETGQKPRKLEACLHEKRKQESHTKVSPME